MFDMGTGARGAEGRSVLPRMGRSTPLPSPPPAGPNYAVAIVTLFAFVPFLFPVLQYRGSGVVSDAFASADSAWLPLAAVLGFFLSNLTQYVLVETTYQFWALPPYAACLLSTIGLATFAETVSECDAVCVVHRVALGAYVLTEAFLLVRYLNVPWTFVGGGTVVLVVAGVVYRVVLDDAEFDLQDPFVVDFLRFIGAVQIFAFLSVRIVGATFALSRPVV